MSRPMPRVLEVAAKDFISKGQKAVLILTFDGQRLFTHPEAEEPYRAFVEDLEARVLKMLEIDPVASPEPVK